MNKNKLKYLVLLTGLLLAGTAAYYSVTGLSKLFAGSAVAIMIMASILEGSKLVLATYLHRRWKAEKFILKLYFGIALFILMAITSIGIYGFIINAYQGTADRFTMANSEIELIEKNKEALKQKIDRYTVQIEFKNDRISNLSSLRKQQEIRLDSLYARRAYNSAKRVETLITETNDEITEQSNVIDSLNGLVFSVNTQIDSLDRTILNIKSENSSGEIGPLLYLSELTGMPMDEIVNWFVLLFVIVFDPLALSLVIAYNKLSESTEVSTNIPVEEVIIGHHVPEIQEDTYLEVPHEDDTDSFDEDHTHDRVVNEMIADIIQEETIEEPQSDEPKEIEPTNKPNKPRGGSPNHWFGRE